MAATVAAAAAAGEELFIGVDGGGTKTAISVASSSGAILGSLTVGSTNPNSVSDEVAARTVNEGIKSVLESIKGDVPSIRSVVLSISGCNTPAHQVRMCGWLNALLPHNWSTLPGSVVSAPPASVPLDRSALVHAYNDSIAALVSGTEGQLDGVVVIAGTGMICKAFHHATGREWTAGGNGALIDKGSGYSLGIGVAHAAFKAHDGMGPPTPLLKATLDELKIQSAPEIVDWLYSDLSWSRPASLATLAFAFAAPADGSPADPVALRLVEEAAEYLAESVKAVAAKLGLADLAQDVPVVCAGGLLQNPLLFRLLDERVRQFLPRAKLVHPKVTPAEGAALLARTLWIEEKQKRTEH